MNSTTAEVSYSVSLELFEAIMKQKWSSLILIKKILQEIPEFLSMVYSLESQKDVMMGLGAYQLDIIYDFDILALSDNVYLLYCDNHDRDQDSMNEKYTIIYIGFSASRPQLSSS